MGRTRALLSWTSADLSLYKGDDTPSAELLDECVLRRSSEESLVFLEATPGRVESDGEVV